MNTVIRLERLLLGSGASQTLPECCLDLSSALPRLVQTPCRKWVPKENDQDFWFFIPIWLKEVKKFHKILRIEINARVDWKRDLKLSWLTVPSSRY